jgi:tungstate transport system substrate-binding protein
MTFWSLVLCASLTWAGQGRGGGDGRRGATAIREVTPSPEWVRTAVIGGMTMTGLWDALAKRFEEKTGLDVVVVVTGQRPLLAEAFRQGRADLLTMHSGDITTDLVADGYGTRMRPWTRNDLVIVGPPSDPAKIRGMKSGEEAFRRIAEAEAHFIDSWGMGAREVWHRACHRAGVERRGDWILRDEADPKHNILLFAQRHEAYVVVGRMPVLFGKMPRGEMQIMVETDPKMRRPYIVMAANPARLPEANHKGARALSDFLLSPETQKVLRTFRAEEFGGIPLFHPVWPQDPHAQ